MVQDAVASIPSHETSPRAVVRMPGAAIFTDPTTLHERNYDTRSRLYRLHILPNF
jgi:hypothetical protein